MSKKFEVYVEVAQRILEVVEAETVEDAAEIVEAIAHDAMNLRNVNTCSTVFTEVISINEIDSDIEEIA